MVCLQEYVRFSYLLIVHNCLRSSTVRRKKPVVTIENKTRVCSLLIWGWGCLIAKIAHCSEISVRMLKIPVIKKQH